MKWLLRQAYLFDVALLLARHELLERFAEIRMAHGFHDVLNFVLGGFLDGAPPTLMKTFLGDCLQMGGTHGEIARVMGVSRRTIGNRLTELERIAKEMVT